MNWIDFAKKYNIENPLEFFADLESVSRKADKPILKQTHVVRARRAKPPQPKSNDWPEGMWDGLNYGDTLI